MQEQQNLNYAGFWMRVGAFVVDSILITLATYPLLIYIYGWRYFDPVQNTTVPGFAGPMDFLITWMLPMLAIIILWKFTQATPGKMAISAKIVDAKTGEKPTTGQLVMRYVGYFVSTLPLGLGLFWIAIDRRKQAWHDKMANTVVVRQFKPKPVILSSRLN